MVAVEGEVDTATAPELEELLSEFDRVRVVVDLENVTFVDSSGLATLAKAHQRISNAGGQLAIDRVQPSVQKVFEITRLTELFRRDAIGRLTRGLRGPGCPLPRG